MKTQTPAMIIPDHNWSNWSEGEALTTNDVYTSRQWRNEHYREVTIMVKCQEIITAGTPGNLLLWVELSPFPTPTPVRSDWPAEAFTSWFTWSPIGGGAAIAPGAANTPLNPAVVVPTGTHHRYQNINLTFTTHQTFARLCAQDPTGATPATSYWWLQAYLTGKGD